MSSRLRLTLFLGITALFLAACQTASSNLYGYDFSTARISYTISGSSTGTSEVLIKGEKKRIHNQISQKKPDGTVQNTNTIMIQNGEKLYTLNSDTKTGSELKQPFYTELQRQTPEQRKQTMLLEGIRDDRSPEEQQKNPPKPEKTEDVAGQKCDLYVSSSNLQTCLWQGIPLKAVASLPDYGIQTETTATSIVLNQDISDSEFDVPQDYQITSLN